MKYGMGDLLIDTGRQSVSRAGTTLTLPKLSYELLLVLVRAAPDVVSVDRLMQDVWPGLVVSPETVGKRVTLLREALGENSQSPRYIATLRGRGYQVIADVAVNSVPEEPPAPPTSKTANPGETASVQPPRVLNTAYLIAAALLFVGIAAITWTFWPGHPPSSSVQKPSLSAPDRSIAVLPFLDMSEAKDQEYFADGMTEAIIDLLTKIPELRVPARTSSFYFKGKAANVSDIARELKVVHILEGSVRKSGNRLRVTAQLIRADSGYHVWSETYDRNPDDIFEVQDEIAAQVAQAMQLRLLDGAVTRHRATPNPEAYGLLLQGRFLGRRNNQQDRERSIDLYRRAIEIDPTYALAWAWLSTGYTVQVLSGWSPPAPGYAHAREAAQRAIDLQPNLADGHSALGHVLEACDWDWAEAKKEYQRALALDPRNVRALNLIGHVAMDEGRLEEAIHLYRAATLSDPLSPGAQGGLAYSLWASGRLAEAEPVYTRLAALNESDAPAWLGLLMVERGEEGGLEEIELDRNEAVRLMLLSMANHRLARQSQSDQALVELTKKYPNSATKIAQSHAYRGEIDEAFRWADKAYAAHDKDLMWLKTHVGLRDLPRDARYTALLRKMNLPD
jgi:TolB-like protein/DNA-binding winged helix-turn-helix (wHTH) protein/tetratricopeptide (TPR) repeat protein